MIVREAFLVETVNKPPSVLMHHPGNKSTTTPITIITRSYRIYQQFVQLSDLQNSFGYTLVSFIALLISYTHGVFH